MVKLVCDIYKLKASALLSNYKITLNFLDESKFYTLLKGGRTKKVSPLWWVRQGSGRPLQRGEGGEAL